MANLVVLLLLAATASAGIIGSRQEFEAEISAKLDLVEFHREMASLNEEVAAEAAQNNADIEEQLKKVGPIPLAAAKAAKDDEDVNDEISDDLFQGDIVLTNAQLDAISGSRKKRQAYTPPNFPATQWPTNRPIPYEFDGRVAEDVRNIFRAAAKFWTDNSCLSFQENAAGKERIRVINGGGCFSAIGMSGGVQELSLQAGGCNRFSTAAHELEHAIGVYHEQSRFDRDQYVELNTANIIKEKLYNFNKENNTFTKNYDVPYEFGSNMHYAQNDFYRDWTKPTLVAKRGYEEYQHSMRGHSPSFLDVLLVNRFYKCTDKCGNSNRCRNYGYPHPRDCNKCVCPEGWGGADCSADPAGAQVVTATRIPQVARIEVGKYGETKIVHDNKFLIIKAQLGQKILLTVKTLNAQIQGEGCFSNGLEIKNKADLRARGLRFCGYEAPKQTIESTAGRVAILIYANSYTTSTDIEYRLA